MEMIRFIDRVPESMKIYNTLRLEYEKFAEKSENEFIKILNSYNSLDQLIDIGFNDSFAIIHKYLDFAIDILVNMKVYNITLDRFIKQYYLKYCLINEVFQDLEELYLQILQQEQDMDAYRKARRKNRGKYYGYTMKGSVKAGTLNMATGLAHSTFNGIGKMISTGKASFKKREIFKNEDIRKNLSFGMYISVFNIHEAILDCLENETNEGIFRITKEDEEEASAIYETLTKRGQYIEPEEKLELLVKIFTRNPYMKDFYTAMIILYGRDEDNGIQECAEFFGLDISDSKAMIVQIETEKFMKNGLRDSSVKDEKEEVERICENYFPKIYLKNNTFGNSVYRENLFKVFERKLDYFNPSEELNDLCEICSNIYKQYNDNRFIEINKKVDKILTDRRTVDGRIYATEDEAKKAIAEKELLKNKYGNVDLKDKKAVNDKLEEVEIDISSCNFNKIDLELYKDKFIKALEEIKLQEELKLIEDEKKCLSEIYDSVDLKNKDDIIRSSNDLEERVNNGEFKTKVPNIYREKFKKSLEEIKKQEEIQKVKMQESNQLDELAKTIDYSDKESVTKAIKIIESKIESGEYITDIPRTYKNKLESILKDLKKHDNIFNRTFNKKQKVYEPKKISVYETVNVDTKQINLDKKQVDVNKEEFNTYKNQDAKVYKEQNEMKKTVSWYLLKGVYIICLLWTILLTFSCIITKDVGIMLVICGGVPLLIGWLCESKASKKILVERKIISNKNIVIRIAICVLCIVLGFATGEEYAGFFYTIAIFVFIYCLRALYFRSKDSTIRE